MWHWQCCLLCVPDLWGHKLVLQLRMGFSVMLLRPLTPPDSGHK